MTASTIKLLLTIITGALAGAQATGVLPASAAGYVATAIVVLTALGYGAHVAAVRTALYTPVPLTPPRSSQAGITRLEVIALLGAMGIGCIAITTGAIVTSCTHAQVVAGENAAKACGEADAGTLLGKIEAALAASDYDVEVAAVATAYNLASDVVNCLVATVTAVEDAATPAGGGSAITASVIAPNPIAAHGHAWLNAHAGSAQ
ncbi:MAG TPA: hypothetical protein VGG74_21350 [Kofleriaceae bacterium]|jgi:hypothetical protein